MRVLVFGSSARSLPNFRGQLLARLASGGHEVFACAPGIDSPTERVISKLGVTPISIRLHRKGTGPLADTLSIFRIIRLFRRLRPDIVLNYTMKPVVYGSIAARLTGARSYALITGLGSAFSESPRKPVLRIIVTLMLRASLKNCDKVIFQNRDDRAEFIRLRLVTPGQTELVAGSGVDLSHFRQHPVPLERPLCLMAGRILIEKGVREFSEAARLVKRVRPDVRFVLLGSEDESRPKITRSDLVIESQSAVECPGYVEDVRPYIAAASIMVLPSYREGTPRSLLEALAVGRAIVATDVPGCREAVLDGRNGLLVPPRNPAKLADAILELLTDSMRLVEMGSESRRLAEDRFDVHRVNEKMCQILGLETQHTVANRMAHAGQEVLRVAN